MLGRVLSFAAKKVILNETIAIINAEKIVITGKPETTVAKYKRQAQIKDAAKPEKSPKFTRRPDLFVKLALRGMLPWQTSRGREAFRRAKAYIGTPSSIKGKTEKPPRYEGPAKTITIGELCLALGWKG